MSSPDKVFDALSSTTRRKILAYLRDRPQHGRVLAARFDLSAPAVSKHLSILEGAGLIWKRREGQFVLYGMDQDNLAGHLWSFMQEVCPPSRALRREVREEMGEGETEDAPVTPRQAD